ncbi:hypothetical protein CW745_07930 [Psychromonas sp. psych-6C06]|uniref:PEP-CTERM sorting domain-containing protein n=1 Tax=Psychromonas sp. psych-6C06 TaxID=2058089 RepID=UPI000C31E16C|nr:PEP-CTERM sorting domain-containing protein [Psychromonas sp. psych-6C06]PKF61911.1 hypothetical protein CW745_07930 [Psychromonas sp. psych-6C06]
MTLKMLTTALSALTLFIAFSASAGVITDTNNDSFIDTSTGLEWMDFGINNGQSYNYVASQLGQGGQYQGWALASKEQVYTMWANAFLGLGASDENANHSGTGQLYVSDGYGVSGSVFSETFDAMGSNIAYNIGTPYEYNYNLAWFAGNNGLSYVYKQEFTGSYYDLNRNDIAYIYDNNNYDSNLNRSYEQRSTMLVRSTVSAPATLAIFALALIGLRFRRQARR